MVARKITIALCALCYLENSHAGFLNFWPFTQATSSPTSNESWNDLSDDEQRALIKRYESLKDEPKSSSTDLQQRMDWFSQLPDHEKQKMRDVWQKMNTRERRDLGKRMQKATTAEQRALIRKEYIEKYITH